MHEFEGLFDGCGIIILGIVGIAILIILKLTVG